MPSRNWRYHKPSGAGWTGGIVGGTLVAEGGEYPWSVVFTDRGKIEKRKRFSDETRAKKWRLKYSNKTGRTINRWRVSPRDPATIEMTVGPNHIVLYDSDMHDTLTQFRWNIHPTKYRVFTTARLWPSKDGMNDEKRKRRDDLNKEAMTSISMMSLVTKGGVKNPRHINKPTDKIVDNRRANITTASEAQKGSRRGKYATKGKKKYKKA